jgi:hypothetical protein
VDFFEQMLPVLPGIDLHQAISPHQPNEVGCFAITLPQGNRGIDGVAWPLAVQFNTIHFNWNLNALIAQ